MPFVALCGYRSLPHKDASCSSVCRPGAICGPSYLAFFESQSGWLGRDAYLGHQIGHQRFVTFLSRLATSPSTIHGACKGSAWLVSLIMSCHFFMPSVAAVNGKSNEIRVTLRIAIRVLLDCG